MSHPDAALAANPHHDVIGRRSSRNLRRREVSRPSSTPLQLYPLRLVRPLSRQLVLSQAHKQHQPGQELRGRARRQRQFGRPHRRRSHRNKTRVSRGVSHQQALALRGLSPPLALHQQPHQRREPHEVHLYRHLRRRQAPAWRELRQAVRWWIRSGVLSASGRIQWDR